MRNVYFPITQSQLLQLKDIHHTDLKISKILNLSVARVCQLRKKFGISIYPSRKENKIRNKIIYREFKETKILKKNLALKYNLSIMTIIRIIKSFKEK
jgi:Mor family transcriptional regulator